jgi:hypothetical protein
MWSFNKGLRDVLGCCPVCASRCWSTGNCDKCGTFHSRQFLGSVTAHCHTVRIHISWVLVKSLNVFVGFSACRRNYGAEMKVDEVTWVCSMKIWHMSRKFKTDNVNILALGVDGNIVRTDVAEWWSVRCSEAASSVDGCCEHGNERSDSAICEEFVGQLTAHKQSLSFVLLFYVYAEET